jgi:hypothetical protein
LNPGPWGKYTIEIEMEIEIDTSVGMYVATEKQILQYVLARTVFM